MPTGYTAALIEEKEISFEKFVLTCSRAFGALIEMRDEPMDAKIPDEFRVSEYHTAELEKAMQRLNEFKSFTSEDYNKKAREKLEQDVADYERRVEKNRFIRQRYSDMLIRVKNWEEPSPDHKELKKFMIEQIESSVKFDIYEPDKPVIMTGEEWANKELASITWNIEYHTKKYQEEVERVASRNGWVKQLRNSLSQARQDAEPIS